MIIPHCLDLVCKVWSETQVATNFDARNHIRLSIMLGIAHFVENHFVKHHKRWSKSKWRLLCQTYLHMAFYLWTQRTVGRGRSRKCYGIKEQIEGGLKCKGMKEQTEWDLLSIREWKNKLRGISEVLGNARKNWGVVRC